MLSDSHTMDLRRSKPACTALGYDRRMRMTQPAILLLLASIATGCSAQTATTDAAARVAMEKKPPRTILVYTRTKGFRHDSIPVALDTLRIIGAADGISIEHSEDPASFTPANLKRMKAVVFANTSGNVLGPRQQTALQDYIEAGGGFLGIHSAADTEFDWPWYGTLVGAWFADHPPGLQASEIVFASDGTSDAATTAWKVTDEIYNFRKMPDATVIARVDESLYSGGSMGNDHPIAWCKMLGKGRSWYTGLGHDAAIYATAAFRAHLRSGLLYATGLSKECHPPPSRERK